MLRNLFVALALLFGAITLLYGEEPLIEMVGEPVITTVDSSFQYTSSAPTSADLHEIRMPTPQEPNLNAITKFPLYGYAIHFAVGDQGKVIKLSGETGQILAETTLLNGEYNFTGVSFVNGPAWYVGWIVGYKRDDPDKWKGVILMTTNGGNDWSYSYP